MLDQRTLKPRTIFCHDNLPILRGINSNSIDLIYLDPPFNKGKDFMDNLQLCGHCNRVKGNRPMEYLLARLANNE